MNPAEVEAAQPVLPPHDGGNPTLQPVAEQSDPFDSLSDDLILEIIKYFSPKDLSRLMRVNRRFCRMQDPFFGGLYSIENGWDHTQQG
ncbi:MAG: F-box protein [Chlamydiales bacterium]|nr:F-box protein [Chlamydiales bacterium]